MRILRYRVLRDERGGSQDCVRLLLRSAGARVIEVFERVV